jgi:hypothetical protein
MAYQSKYAGAWNRRTQVDTVVVTQAPIDPEHLTPTDNVEFSLGQTPAWANTAPAPDVPDAVLDQQLQPLAAGFGPVDHTPIDHAYGMGTGPGLSTLEAQDYRMAWHMQDDGSVAAHQWNPMQDRDDRPGSPHVDFWPHAVGDGESPQTLQLERTGYGQPNDPEAPLGRWFRRWRDREMDMHRFDPSMRPVAPKYARPTPVQPAAQDGSQIAGPFPTAVSVHLGPQDTFVPALVRRVPGPWDEALSSDGTAETMAGAAGQYGLTTWGL